MVGWLIAAIVLAVISIGISIYRMVTAKGPPEPPVPSKSEIDSIPAADLGKAIPVLFGTRILSQANVVWWGNPSNERIKVQSSQIP
jgi:hypothetical protein